MRALEGIEPKSVFYFFEELTKIPRPSYQEKAVSDYLVRFAKERSLEVHQDDLYNVIIIKEASEGYESEEPIILQGHMDMVCEKNPGVTKDMEKEGLDLIVEGDTIRADGTTLGADDGIAVAYALALLDSDTLRHPRLEFVCTVSEEVGMEGAHGIDVSPLKGHLLLNIDSEDEGILLAGCAGGASAIVRYEAERRERDWQRMTLHIHGLTGGHSGTEINKGRASSVELTGRVLRALSAATKLRLVALENGTKDNAISRDSCIVLAVANLAAAKAAIAKEEAAIQKEYRVADPSIVLTVEEKSELEQETKELLPLTKKATRAVIGLLSAMPQGILRMDDHIAGMVETSLNWGVASLNADGLLMRAAVRSSLGTAKEALLARLSYLADRFGASFEVRGEYPAWEWVTESVLRDKAASIYKEMFGKDLIIQTIHAGVECGLLSDKIPGMDAISIGPDIHDAHTPKEHVSIASVQRTWEFIVKLIETR